MTGIIIGILVVLGGLTFVGLQVAQYARSKRSQFTWGFHPVGPVGKTSITNLEHITQDLSKIDEALLADRNLTGEQLMTLLRVRVEVFEPSKASRTAFLQHPMGYETGTIDLRSYLLGLRKQLVVCIADYRYSALAHEFAHAYRLVTIGHPDAEHSRDHAAVEARLVKRT